MPSREHEAAEYIAHQMIDYDKICAEQIDAVRSGRLRIDKIVLIEMLRNRALLEMNRAIYAYERDTSVAKQCV